MQNTQSVHNTFLSTASTDLYNPQNGFFNFRLYIAGQTPKSLSAIANLKSLCERHLSDQYHIEIIDIAKNPERAVQDQILALPTLIRSVPEPIKRMIGTLSDIEKVMVGLDIKSKDNAHA